MADYRQAKFPFNDYLIVKPAYSKKEHRYVMNLKSLVDGSRTSTSYARLIYQIHHKILLTDEQCVDHIDGDCTHDQPNNLQVLTRSENNKKRIKEHGLNNSTRYVLKCPWCFSIFEKAERELKKGEGSYCSRSCAVSFQMTTLDPDDRQIRLMSNVVSTTKQEPIIIEHSHNILDWRTLGDDYTELKIINPPRFCIACKTVQLNSDQSTYCSTACMGVANRKVQRPSKEDLEAYVKLLGYLQTGKKFGVSDNTIRKWLKAA